MRQQRSVMALVPRSTVHTHCNPWRILGVKNIYFRGDEIFKFENQALKHNKSNNIKTDKTKIQKCLIKTHKKLVIEFKSGKQASCADTYLTKGKTKQGNRNWCEENKLKKLIVLNYTERGKQQELQLKLFIL